MNLELPIHIFLKGCYFDATEMKCMLYKRMYLLNESDLWKKITGKYQSYTYLKLIINDLYMLMRYSVWKNYM